MKEQSLSAETQSLLSPIEEDPEKGQDLYSHPLQHISEELLEKILVGWFLILFGLILIRNAWLSDDSYITLRVVDNFVNGYGLRYNIDERVQPYTHPLWMFLISGIYFFTREGYLTLLLLSFVFSLLTVAFIAFRFAATPVSALLAILTMILSQSFMDFSTSGLENPLTHLFSLVILLLYLKQEARFKTVLQMAFLVCLATLNRMDTLLLFLPMLAVWVWRSGLFKGIFAAGLGFLPFALWEIFSILYYGFPFPNTAYAKLGADVGTGRLFVQALFYFLHSVETDPLTPLVIFLGLLIPFLVGNRKHIPVIAGVVLYLVYLLRIGGDFMGGRFFSAPFLIMVALIATYPLTTTIRTWPLPFVVVLIMGLCSSNPTLIIPERRTAPREGESIFAGYISPRGISNEKLYYFYRSGLINANPDLAIAWEGGPIRGTEHSKVRVVNCAGFYGYDCPREVHIVDIWALIDPLLARLPSVRSDRGEGRIGHFERMLPEGYYETLETGKDQFTDRFLAEYYGVLSRIIRDDLFTPGRLRAIWDMNRGYYNHLIDTRRYLNPDMKLVHLKDAITVRTEGTPLDDSALLRIGVDGLQVDLGETWKSSRIEISLDPSTPYDLYFTASPHETGHLKIAPSTGKAGLVIHEIQVPPGAVESGYNLIRIIPERQTPDMVLGHIRRLDS